MSSCICPCHIISVETSFVIRPVKHYIHDQGRSLVRGRPMTTVGTDSPRRGPSFPGAAQSFSGPDCCTRNSPGKHIAGREVYLLILSSLEAAAHWIRRALELKSIVKKSPNDQRMTLVHVSNNPGSAESISRSSRSGLLIWKPNSAVVRSIRG